MLIALVVVAVMSLVVIIHATDVDVSDDVPWERVVFGLALGLCGLTLLKNLTDADSTWVATWASRWRPEWLAVPTSTGRANASGNVRQVA